MNSTNVLIWCLVCTVNVGFVFCTEDRKSDSKVEDMEGAETVGKLFSLFPSYGSNPVYRPNGSGYYPSYGSNYYPSTPSYGSGYYPSYNPSYYPSSGAGAGYFPSGTNILGHGYGNYPTQPYYTTPNTWYNTRSSDNGGSGSGIGYGGYSGYGGYGGYGGNGGIKSYYGYNNPQYGGKRNLGYGYYSDTDRYGFYKTPSQQLSVNRGYE